MRRTLGGRVSRPRKKSFVAAFGVMLALIVFPALSGAVAINPPVVTTDPASGVTSTGATLNGTITPNDLDSGAEYTFSWGQTTSYGTDVTGTTDPGITPQSVSVALTALTPGTTYHFKVCATNSPEPPGGTDCGNDRSFTTPDAPSVTTGNATAIAQTGATLNGTVDPNGDDTTYTFSYGTSSGSYPSSVSGTVSAGTSPQAVSKAISSLAPQTTYFYRLCATNTFGTGCGGEQSFITPDAPTAVAGAPSAITTNGATLAGTVNPNGANVTATFFKYGTTSSYGLQASATPSPGSGRSPVAVSATLSGLAAGTTFHYTLCATNTFGTNCDPTDRTFTTNQPPTATLGADKASGPTPLAVTFNGAQSTDAPPGTIASWVLQFGSGEGQASGTGIPGSSIQHTYSNGGMFTARLTVTDDQGATGTTTLAITVTANKPPVAHLTVSPASSGTVPLAVSFDGSTSADPDNIPLKSWSLDFADGSSPATGTGSVPSAIAHTYATAGTFNAKLTVVDSSDASASSTVPITVNPPPVLNIGDASVTEGQIANFLVRLSAVSTHDITVGYATSDGTALSGSGDYTTATGTLTIPAGSCGPGTTNCLISVQALDDSAFESSETFSVTLSSPIGATIGDGVGTGTILDNDPAPVVMIANAQRLEGNEGSAVTAPQTWSAGGSLTLVNARGMPNSAASAAPFYLISPGSTQATPTAAGTYRGPFTYSGKNGNTLLNVRPEGSALAGQIAFRPIPLSFTVLLCDAARSGITADQCTPTTSGQPTTVQFATVNGVSDSASHAPVKSGQDYVAACSVANAPGAACSGPVSPPITISPGATSATVTVSLIGNMLLEDSTRHFTLKLLSVVNASIRWGLGAGLILDDDIANPPTASTGDASGINSNGATVAATANAQGEPATAYIEYGTSAPGYGLKTAAQGLPVDLADHALSFNLAGLAPSTTYHYRVVATRTNNATGYGEDRTFTTASPPPPPPPPPPLPPPPPPPPPTPPPQPRVQVRVTLMTRTTTVTTGGVIRVTIKCKAPAGVVCRGRIDLDLFGTPAGSRSFRINAGKHPSVPIKLRPKVWKALQSSKRKRLKLNVTISYRSAGKTDYSTASLNVQGPRVRQKQDTSPPGK